MLRNIDKIWGEFKVLFSNENASTNNDSLLYSLTEWHQSLVTCNNFVMVNFQRSRDWRDFIWRDEKTRWYNLFGTWTAAEKYRCVLCSRNRIEISNCFLGFLQLVVYSEQFSDSRKLGSVFAQNKNNVFNCNFAPTAIANLLSFGHQLRHKPSTHKTHVHILIKSSNPRFLDTLNFLRAVS